MKEDSSKWLNNTIKTIKESEYCFEVQLWDLIEGYFNKNYPHLENNIGDKFRYNLLRLHIYNNLHERIFLSGRYFFEEGESFSYFGYLNIPPYLDDKTLKLNEQRTITTIKEIALIPIILFGNSIAWEEYFNDYKESRELIKNLSENIINEKNKRRTHDIKLLQKMKKIETTTTPKPKQLECLIKANRILKKYPEQYLLDVATGKPTQKAVDIINSYKSQKKDL